ncbi:MAG: trigger factor [Frankiaceae bacterium]|nr:trigger factor [Frankiaceae bacterium]MDQ1726778.1 trigger factor [Frankiaceae bacterium]
MKTTVETVSETRVKLTVEVEPAELKPSLDAAYKAIAQQVRVPGFRQGKVPPPIIDRQVGRAVVVEQAIQDAVPQFYTDAVRENDIKVLGQPDVDVTQYNDGDVLIFTAEVDVRPEIAIPPYDDIAVTVDSIEPSDEDLDEQLDALRERFATLTTVDRPAQAGDYASIDLSATVDGEDVPDANAKGLSYEIGSGTLVDGLDDELTGAAAGETSTFTTRLPAGLNEGSDAEVTVTVNSIKTKDLPPLDDSFAQLASEFDTLEELRNDVRERLSRVRVREQAVQARDKVLEAILAKVEIPVPDDVVKAEAQYRRDTAHQQLQAAGLTLESYLEAEGTDVEKFETELYDGAVVAMKARLLLDAIADNEKFEINDQELSDQVVRHAQRSGVRPDQFQQYANQLVQGGHLPALVGEVLREKALTVLVEAATITDSNGNTIDLDALEAAEG